MNEVVIVSGPEKLPSLHMEAWGNLLHVRCDLCGLDESVVLFEKDGFKHVKCHNCDLVYINPRLKNPIKHQETFYDNLAIFPAALMR
jgi:ribosomal protein S27E